MRLICEVELFKKTCKMCAATFESSSKRALYCSVPCRNKYNSNKKEAKRKALPEVEKICQNCGAIFSHGRSDKKYCSEKCGNRVRGNRWDQNNKERLKKMRKKLKNNNWRNYKLSRVKSYAKTRGIPFALTLEDLDMPEKCPILGIKLNYASENKKEKWDSPSVSRVIPDLGYIKGNIKIVSLRAALLRSNADIWELEKVLDDFCSPAKGEKDENNLLGGMDKWCHKKVIILRNKSRYNNIPFNIDKSDLEPVRVCPILGINLNYSNKLSGYYPDSASVDKIIPELGYVKGNVRIISARANLLKNNATEEEIRLVVNSLKNPFNSY